MLLADWFPGADTGKSPGWQVTLTGAQMNTWEEEPHISWRLSPGFFLKGVRETLTSCWNSHSSVISHPIGPHLHQSQPHWRCPWRPARGSAQSSSPSRSWRWSSCESPHGAAGGAQGPSWRRPELSEGLCQSPGSASGTSGSFPPSTAGLQRENRYV